MSRDKNVLYKVAMQIAHEFGYDYTHPVTGRLYKCPQPERVKEKRALPPSKWGRKVKR